MAALDIISALELEKKAEDDKLNQARAQVAGALNGLPGLHSPAQAHVVQAGRRRLT